MSNDLTQQSDDLDDLLNQHLTKRGKEGANVAVYVLEYLLGSSELGGLLDVYDDQRFSQIQGMARG